MNLPYPTYKILKYFPLFVFGLLALPSSAQKSPRNPITSINLQIAPGFVPEIDSIFDIGLSIEFQNGKRRKTQGLNKGTKSWNSFEVNVNQGFFENGKIHFDREAILKSNDKKLNITIAPKKQADFYKEFQIDIPYLKSIFIEYDSTSMLVPGYEIPYWIREEYSSTKNFYSPHKSKKDAGQDFKQFPVSLSDYIIESPDRLIINKKGITLPISDSIIYSSIILNARHKKHNHLHYELQIPINYSAKYSVKYKGVPGNHGYHGHSGYSSDVGDGGDGERGGDGDNGFNGINLQIYAMDQFLWNGDTLVQIAFESVYGVETLIIDANKGKVTVQSNGGVGGNGGNGGGGGSGADETYDYSAGWGGDGGHGGDGGNGGKGGDIIIYHSSAMAFDSSLLIIQNEGGRAGSGGLGGRKGIGGSYLDDSEDDEDEPILLSLFKIIVSAAVSFNNGEKGKNGEPGKKGEKGNIVIIENFNHGD